MKKKLQEIFDGIKPNELDQFSDLLSVPKLPSHKLSSVKSKVFAKTDIKYDAKGQNNVWIRFCAVAACFCMIIGVITVLPMMRRDETPDITQDFGTKDRESSDPVVTTDSADTLSSMYVFKSFEEFEKHERNAGANAVSYYYIPSALSSDYELARITKRDKGYVMIEYSVDPNAVSLGELSGYDAERLQTLICKYSLFEDGEKALKLNFIDKGYEAVEFEGKTYYRWDEYAENNPEKQIIGYEIAFLVDGELIFMHLPAVDTFENMMNYAKVTRINIG